MKFVSVIFAVILNLVPTFGEANQLFYCVEFSCQEPISVGKTLLRYNGKTDQHLSFSKNEDIKILSKPISDGDDWVGYCRGKVGLVPKNMVREMKMNKYDSKFQYPFQHLPLWEPNVKVKESNENYVDTGNELPSNSPPILDISPVTVPGSDTELADNSAVSNNSEGSSVEVKPLDPSTKEGSNDVPTIDGPNASEAKEDLAGEESQIIKEIKENIQTETSTSVPQQEKPEDEDKKALNDDSNVEADAIEDEEAEEAEEAISDEKSVNNAEQVSDVSSSEAKKGTEPSEIFEADKSNVNPSESPALEKKENEDAGKEPENPEVKEPIPIEVAPNQDVKPEENPVSDSSTSDAKNITDEEKSSEQEFDPEVKENAETSVPEIDTSTPSIFSAVKDFTSNVINFLPEDLRVNDDVPSTTEARHETTSPPQEEAATKISVDETITNPDVTKSNAGQTAPSEISENVKVSDKVDRRPSTAAVASEATPEVTSEAIPAAASEAIPEATTTQAQDSATKVPEPADTETATPVTTNVDAQAEIPSQPLNNLEDAAGLASQKKQEEGDKQEPSTTEAQELPAATVPPILATVVPKVEEDVPAEKGDIHLTASPAPSESPVAESTPLPEPHVYQAPPETTTQTDVPVEVSVTEKPEVAYDRVEELTEVTESPVVPVLPPNEPSVEERNVESAAELEHDHEDHDHHHHHHHHHHREHSTEKNDGSTWSIIVVVKHLSGTLLSLLPEHLQDSILDVDSALVFTGIIALMLVSICVPYFLIESIMSVRPLKKQVVELNKSLWKVSAAYENQQEEFDTYKKKALAYDEDQKRIEQLEMELQILKKLEGKQKEQVKLLQKQLKTSAKAADGIEDLIEVSIKEKEMAIVERNRLQVNYASLEATLKEKLEELENAQASGSALALDLEVVNHEKDNLAKRLAALETELELIKTKLGSETELRRTKATENDLLTKERNTIQAELLDLRRILHQYEDNVSTITEELTAKENELQALKETLGEDSPLIDISETKAKLKSAEEEAASLKARCETVAFENASLTRDLEETKAELSSVKAKKEEAENNLKVLEGYFRKKEEELRTAVAKLEVEQSVKHKDKDDLVKMIREKESEVQMLISTNEKLKQEVEDMKSAHRNELRTAEAKADEHWLSLCQSERKYAEARKECEQLRQKLVALVKEKDGDDNDRLSGIGDGILYSLPPEMVPPPPLDDMAPMASLSYFPLDDDFIPPAPLPIGSEPMRPPPLGRLSPTTPNNNYSYLEDEPSPIGRGSVGGRGDYSEDSSGSDSPDHRRPGSRDNWINENRSNDRLPPNRRRRANGNGPKNSSPLPHGVNL